MAGWTVAEKVQEKTRRTVWQEHWEKCKELIGEQEEMTAEMQMVRD